MVVYVVCDKRLEQLNLTFLENGNESRGGGGKVHVVVSMCLHGVYLSVEREAEFSYLP